jgi:long-subunit acyl-CoA synthetase (AMP-forming)
LADEPSPFLKQKKQWHLGSPQKVALNMLPIHHVGTENISKLARSSTMKATVKSEQSKMQETLQAIKQEDADLK